MQDPLPTAAAARPGSHPTKALAGALALLFLTVAILVGFADIFFILRHHTRFPFGDQWIWLERMYRDGLLSTLACQFNEHRLVIPGLFYFLDHRYFGATNYFLTVLLLLMQAGCIFLLILPVWRQPDVPSPVRYVFAGFVVIAMWWYIQAEDFFLGYQVCILCCNLAILIALRLFARFLERSRRSRPVLWLGIATLATAFIATFTNGHGILLWPVLLALGFMVRLPWKWLLAVACVMLSAAGLYFFHYQTPALHAGPVESLRHPIHLAHYVVLMIGIPFFEAGAQDIWISTHVAAYAISIAGILLALLLVLRLTTNRTLQQNACQVIYCALTMLCLGACGLTALGRSRFPLSQALTSRYAPVSLLFWIGLAGLLTVSLCAAETRGGLGRLLWCVLLAVASLATLSSQVPTGEYWKGREKSQDAAALSISMGMPDVDRVSDALSLRLNRVLYVDRQAASTLGHSLFARPESSRLGTRLTDRFQLVPSSECLGVVDRAERLPEPATNGVRWIGWAWDIPGQTAVARVWIVDDQQRVRGLGISQIYRSDVANALADPRKAFAGWIGYSQPAAPGSTLTVFASLADGRSVCQVGLPRAPAITAR